MKKEWDIAWHLVWKNKIVEEFPDEVLNLDSFRPTSWKTVQQTQTYPQQYTHIVHYTNTRANLTYKTKCLNYNAQHTTQQSKQYM